MPPPYTLSRRRLLALLGGAAAAAVVGCGAAEPAKETPAKDAHAKPSGKGDAKDGATKDGRAKDGHAKENAPKAAAKEAPAKGKADQGDHADKHAGEDGHGSPGADEHGEPRPSFGPTYLIKDRVVNLADPAVRRYLRFSAAIEFAPHEKPHARGAPAGGDPSSHLVAYTPEHDGYQPVTGGKDDADKAFQSQVKRYVPAMEDAVLTLLSSKTYAEVATAERRESTKRELRSRLSALLDGTDLRVTNVYFTAFVVQ